MGKDKQQIAYALRALSALPSSAVLLQDGLQLGKSDFRASAFVASYLGKEAWQKFGPEATRCHSLIVLSPVKMKE